MDFFVDTRNLYAFTAWLLLQLLHNQKQPSGALTFGEADDNGFEELSVITNSLMGPAYDASALFSASLSNFRLCTMATVFDEDVSFWVHPRSTTWFSRFLLEQYDDERWVQMFRMSKRAVVALADLLRPHVERQNTKYRIAIPVLIRVACSLFKLTHGASLIVCSEMFAVGKSTVSIMLRDVVNAINDGMREEISWPTGEKLRQVQVDFKRLCGLPAVVGAIDGTHISISKPQIGPADYYYFKSGGYTMNCQAVVDSDKRFLDLFLGMSGSTNDSRMLGMPGSTNDSRMLRRSSLHHLAMHNNLFDRHNSVDGFPPFLVGDSGYPLLPWLMVPVRGPGRLTVAEELFNRRLRRGRCVVENAFGILKQTFRELLVKSQLHVTFLPDVITACAILHNVLLGQSVDEVEQLLNVLRTEGFEGEVIDDEGGQADDGQAEGDDVVIARGSEVRRELGLYLTMQRNVA